MTGRISGNTPIRGNSHYIDNEGVTLRPSRGPDGTTESRATSAPQARGRMEDIVVPRGQSTEQTARQASIAATHAEIRSTARSLLQQAEQTPAGPQEQIPDRPASFQALVDQQHDRALREGAISTVATVVSGGIGLAASAATNAGRHTAAVASVAAAEAHHIYHAAQHRSLGEAAGVAVNAVGHVATEAFMHGAEALEGVGGGLMAGAQSLFNSMRNIQQDTGARTEFQQRATTQDSARQLALRKQRENQEAGAVDARFAAAGRGEINWDLFRRNGDYAQGVRMGLRAAEQNPSTVAALRLSRHVERRSSLPGDSL